MPSNLTITSNRLAVSAPDENEVYNWPLIRAAIQSVAGRAEWNKTDLVVAGTLNIAATGDYPSSTSWTTLSRSAVNAEIQLTVAVGDIVKLYASGSCSFSAADSSYGLRIYDGTNQLTGQGFVKGAAWTAGECIPWSMQTVWVAASAGTVTFSLQGIRSATPVNITEFTSGKLVFAYEHIKKGAA